MFDFTGTGTEVWGNCNAPRAITLSALIYCLRCMVGQDIPLNQVHDQRFKTVREGADIILSVCTVSKISLHHGFCQNY